MRTQASLSRISQLVTPRLPADPLRAFIMFEQGRTPAQVSLRRLVKRLVKAGIVHAIMGGMAVYAHGHRRFTIDVDVLLTPEGLAEFKRRFVPKNYQPVLGRPRRFKDRLNGVTLDFLVAGRFPGSGQPGPIAFPNPQDVRQTVGNIDYVKLITLIQL